LVASTSSKAVLMNWQPSCSLMKCCPLVRTEDEGLYPIQHGYWEDVMRHAVKMDASVNKDLVDAKAASEASREFALAAAAKKEAAEAAAAEKAASGAGAPRRSRRSRRR